jgi:hypothetical protein
VYIRRNVIFLVYVDDGIFASPDSEAINKAIEEIKELGLDIDDQGDIEDYLGVNVERVGDTFVLTQPQLIDQIIEDLALEGSRPKPIPALSTRPLIRDENEPRAKDIKYNYRSIVGKLNFLEKSTRPDISYATHMVARFSEDPRESHHAAILHIGQYLLSTRARGLILKPNPALSLEVFVDADFSGNWNKPTAADDPATSKSRTGYVLKFTDCPLLWQSKLQTITALSSCESEYMALSAALRDAIFVIQILDDLKARGFVLPSKTPQVYCKAFEDNSGALEMARLPKLRPRTKHVNLSFHHFREYARKRLLEIHPIETANQEGDIFTKPLGLNLFQRFRKRIMGW